MTTGRFRFNARHQGTLTDVEVFDLYARLCAECSLGDVTHFWLEEFTSNDMVPGRSDSIRARLNERPRGLFQFRVATGLEFSLVLEAGSPRLWSVRERTMKLDAANLERLIGLCEALFRLSDPPTFIGLDREERDVRFVPSPPLARHRHVMMTNDAEAGEMYDEPKLFWRVWDTVLEAGDRRLCVRGRRAAELHDFIVRAFEGNVLLAHHARPGMTEYGLPDARLRQKLEKEYGPWWVLGPREEEKAGMPALTLVGHDPNANTIHYTGLIEREGKEESGRVQVRELYELDRLRYDEDGEPVPGRVHVLFLDEWMARQERRPLLDVGARVFYYAKDGTKVEVTD